MILSLILLFFPVYSSTFYCCYLLAGVTDMIDGTVARTCKTANEFGAKLDTIADLAFAIASADKFLPLMNLPVGIWIWTGLILVDKALNIITGYVIKKKYVSVHTAANKLTGLLLFLFPLTQAVINVEFSAVVVCIAASFAAIQEGHFIRSRHSL